MSNVAEYISIEDAEKLTGLSKNTLVRFASAGYFPTKPVNDGDYLIASKELCEMLKIDQPINTNDHTSNDTKYENSNYDSAGRSSADYEGVVIDFPKDNIPEQKLDDHKDTELSTELSADMINKIEEPKTDIESSLNNNNKNIDNNIRQANKIESNVSDSISNSELLALQANIVKLEKVVELQEQLLHSQDNEIKDLKKQRKWLQERVERLEDKGERDQLLLISETQMLTKMFLQQVNKKSLFAQTLEWLGLKINNSIESKNIVYNPVVNHKEDKKD